MSDDLWVALCPFKANILHYLDIKIEETLGSILEESIFTERKKSYWDLIYAEILFVPLKRAYNIHVLLFDCLRSDATIPSEIRNSILQMIVQSYFEFIMLFSNQSRLNSPDYAYKFMAFLIATYLEKALQALANDLDDYKDFQKGVLSKISGNLSSHQASMHFFYLDVLRNEIFTKGSKLDSFVFSWIDFNVIPHILVTFLKISYF